MRIKKEKNLIYYFLNNLNKKNLIEKQQQNYKQQHS